MSPRRKLRSTAAAAALSALAVLGAVPATSPAKKPKPARGGTKVAREIAALERATNVLSGEIAALGSRTATLEAPPRPPLTVPTIGTPTPSPPGPAAGDFGDSFPNPQLQPKTVGTAQLAENSVTSDDVVDGSIVGSQIAPRSLGGEAFGTLEEVDFSSAANADTLAGRHFRQGPTGVFQAGVPDEQTLTVSSFCPAPARIVAGGWKIETFYGDTQVMSSAPAFTNASQSPERDWTVVAHKELTAGGVTDTVGDSELCIR